MTTLGFIGSGLMATAVAKLAGPAGLSVTTSNSRTGTAEAAAADVVVLALPLGKLPGFDAALLDGRTVLDLTNYYPHRDGRIEALDSNAETTGQWVQRHLPGARVVRGFSNISHLHIPQLARPSGAADRTALPLAGDDPAAKEEVAALIERIGFDTADAGPMAESWRFEPNTVAYLLCYAPDGTTMVELQAAPGQPAGTEQIRSLLARAERTDQSTRDF
jgi:8-hydroxy-5-deazaflavin:NADPH oxidoreductase